MAWSASQYLKFEDERTQPARDLLAGVPLETLARAVDLGCGPGNSTELLVARYPDAEITGVDSDDNMLTAARKRLPSLHVEQADLARWAPPQPVDLLFANAVFQWLPDHLEVMDRLMDCLNPGGVLAVQMPNNLGEASHLLMEDTLHDGPWATAFVGKSLRRRTLPDPEVYRDRLAPKSREVKTWRTVYRHPMADAAAIVAMVQSTGLRPYLAAVGDDHAEDFLEAYRARIDAAYPPEADGKRLFLFPRLFVVAQKA